MRWLVIGAGVLLIVLAIALLGGSAAAGGWLDFGWAYPVAEVAGRLAFGWWSYLARVVPRVAVSRDGVVTGVACLALFTAGLHGFLRWLHGELRRAAGPPGGARRRWSFRWTTSLVAIVVLMFVAGISAAGLVHQAGWLASSGRPLLTPRPDLSDSGLDGISGIHLKVIGLGAWIFVDAHGDDALPGGRPEGQRSGLQSWQTEILPYLGVTTGGEIHRDLPWDDPRNSAYFRGIVPPYLNPEIGAIRSPEGYALSHYAGNVHVLGRERPLRLGQVRGGISNMILAGEVSGEFRPWGDPTNLRDPSRGLDAAPGGFGGPSGLGANVLFLDGSVRFLRVTTSPEVLRRLSVPTSPATPSSPPGTNPAVGTARPE